MAYNMQYCIRGETLHNHIQRVIHRMKYELHKSGNDHSLVLIPGTF